MDIQSETKPNILTAYYAQTRVTDDQLPLLLTHLRTTEEIAWIQLWQLDVAHR